MEFHCEGSVCQRHTVSKREVESLRNKLLEWYDANKRTLPWREMAAEEDADTRGYAVWVSEIMLQQTQVATVISYYKKWMKKWPTIEDLSKATLQEVHEMWAGLGYYSRATRLHEGAQKIMSEMGGHMPSTCEHLLKHLPGVGRYTAGAIASIAYQQVTGLVDGNVSRVFSRLRGIGCDVTTQHAIDHLWNLANKTVDSERPGDYNQALMELGATVCTPKNPRCSECPLKTLCVAYAQVESGKSESARRLQGGDANTKVKDKSTVDIEEVLEGCKLCFGEGEKWEKSLGVENYPRKGRKKAARRERTAVCIVEATGGDVTDRRDVTDRCYLVTQRPDKGLLAGLWEFPSAPVGDQETDGEVVETLGRFLEDTFHVPHSVVKKQAYIGEVVHLFSHIHQTYIVYHVPVTSSVSVHSDRATKWVTKEEFLQSAVSTAMKKIFKAYEAHGNKTAKVSHKRKSTSNGEKQDKKQRPMTAFFKPAS